MPSLGQSILVRQIVNEISQTGPLPFFEFMNQALYAPGLGYYSAGERKFGAEGDFITAPELSPLFSQCLARQCQQVLIALAHPIILEFGAGSGVMAVELLLELERQECMPEAYWIIELSAELQARQQALFQQRAPELLSMVHWLSALPSQPFQGVVLANEVLDAMPVHKFRFRDDKIEEAYVDYQQQQFIWQWAPPRAPLAEATTALALPFTDDYESEMNLLLNGWIKSIGCCLLQGLVLLIDYGFPRHEYYHPDRYMGTLMCHRRHRGHTNPLIYVGQQDITTHVDFTAVAMAGDEQGFEVSGYTSQASFLMSCGITDLVDPVDGADTLSRVNQLHQIKQLLLPGEMGALFKVMALTKGNNEMKELPLLGFQQANDCERLFAPILST